MGFKKSSDLITVSFGVTETAPNTFIQDEVALQLDILNNEIFVVLAVNLDPFSPDSVPATDTLVQSSLTSTTQTAVATLASSNTIAVASSVIRAAGYVDSGVGFQTSAGETPPSTLDYISLIATNNFFIQCLGTGNNVAKGVSGKLYGYRARADASTYAALVQSEVLSA